MLAQKRARIALTWVVGSESNTITTFKVGRHLFQALTNLVNRLAEPAGRSTASLGRDKPLIKAHWRANRG